MASCLWLERPGRWRGAALGVLALALLLPSAPLLARGLAAGGDLTAFGASLLQSASIAAWTTGVTFALGLPGGVATALYVYPMRRFLLALATLPLVLPPFLLSIGWSYSAWPIAGAGACVLVFSATLGPLALLASYATARGLPRSLIEAARLAGGERAVLRAALCYAAPPTALASSFAGVLTLSDPGPGQIFGVRTAASEILISYAAQYDFALAARQCLLLSAVVLACSAPLLWLAAPRVGTAMLARSPGSAPRRPAGPLGLISVAALVTIALCGVVAPVAGLIRPLFASPWSALVDRPHVELVALWAYGEVVRTVADTLVYALSAAAVSVALALAWALSVGRRRDLLVISAGLSLALLALPSATTALGMTRLVAVAPSWADGLLRGPFTVSASLGLRLAPLAALLVLRGYAVTAPSWTLAAALHGVPVSHYLARVLLPILLPAVLLAALLVALLATADVTTVLLLHPPGQASLPLAIFTVMANAPERLVAMLCLAYVGLAGVALVGVWSLAARA